MKDLKEELAGLLAAVDGVQVFYYYPQQFLSLPVISYYEASNVPHAAAEDREYMTEVVFHIDLWTVDLAGLAKYSENINQVLTGDGYIRQFAGDLPDPSGIYRKALKYKKLV